MAEVSLTYTEAKVWSAPKVDGYVPDLPEAYADRRSRQVSELEHPWHAIRLSWTWPFNPFERSWSSFRIVRSIRSPVTRVEEGLTMVEAEWGDWDQIDPDTDLPFYVDPRPPAGEWTFYTFFFLDSSRVWRVGPSVYEMAPANHGWTLRLPGLLPGVTTNRNLSMLDPVQQSSTLVKFLQGPATMLDRASSIIESVQDYWDPLKTSPQSLPYLAESWGYSFDPNAPIGMERIRQVLNALKSPSVGTMQSLQEVIVGVSGYDCDVYLSDNLMLGVSDSSFETGDIYDTGWEPVKPDVGDQSTWLEVRPITDILLPENVLANYYLYIPQAARIACGSYTKTTPLGEPVIENGEYVRVFDPIKAGVPISTWDRARMMCYARHGLAEDPAGTDPTGNTVTMGMDIYDNEGLFVRTVEVLAARSLIETWENHANGDGDNDPDETVPIPTEPVTHTPADIITNAANWADLGAPWEGPQSGITATTDTNAIDIIRITWNAAPSAGNGAAAVVFHATDLVVGAEYEASIRVQSDAASARWNMILAWDSTDVVTDYGSPYDPALLDGEPANATLRFTAKATEVDIGIEALEDSDWSAAGSHDIYDLSIVRQNSEHAYAVPWVQVLDACSIDLIVLDDGRRG